LPGCKNADGTEDSCVKFTVEYPSVVKAPAQETATKINAEILAALQPKDAPRGFEAEAKNLIEDFENYRKEFPTSAIRYFVERKAKVITSHAGALSVQVDDGWFTGGAHPNTRRSYLNLRPQTGENIRFEDILIADNLPGLTAAGEAAFRVERGLAADKTVQSAGYTFPGGKFELNRTWGIGADGLVFYFNSYEIAPYSAGPTELKIGWDAARLALKGDAGIVPAK
jgi:hypothetical protein